jgi:hypothetical protein
LIHLKLSAKRASYWQTYVFSDQVPAMTSLQDLGSEAKTTEARAMTSYGAFLERILMGCFATRGGLRTGRSNGLPPKLKTPKPQRHPRCTTYGQAETDPSR